MGKSRFKTCILLAELERDIVASPNLKKIALGITTISEIWKVNMSGDTQ